MLLLKQQEEALQHVLHGGVERLARLALAPLVRLAHDVDVGQVAASALGLATGVGGDGLESVVHVQPQHATVIGGIHIHGHGHKESFVARHGVDLGELLADGGQRLGDVPHDQLAGVDAERAGVGDGGGASHADGDAVLLVGVAGVDGDEGHADEHHVVAQSARVLQDRRVEEGEAVDAGEDARAVVVAGAGGWALDVLVKLGDELEAQLARHHVEVLYTHIVERRPGAVAAGRVALAPCAEVAVEPAVDDNGRLWGDRVRSSKKTCTNGRKSV